MTIEEIIAKLKQLQEDPSMVTKSAYSPAAVEYSDSRFPFVEIHLAYLRKHPQVDPAQYISNLQLMIKKR